MIAARGNYLIVHTRVTDRPEIGAPRLLPQIEDDLSGCATTGSAADHDAIRDGCAPDAGATGSPSAVPTSIGPPASGAT